MTLAFRKALAVVSKDKDLTPSDRAHLRRWDDYSGDPAWDKLATSARAFGRLPLNEIYLSVIREALFIRRHAEIVQSGVDFELRERQQYRQHLLELAKKADDLADYYKWAEGYSGTANYYSRVLKPVSDLQELHRTEAEILRRRAGKPPKPAARVSRRDRSKGRKGLRKINAFIDRTDRFLKDWVSEKPNHEAIATLTEIAFPGNVITAEDVRQALRPTTKTARKIKSRAFGSKKS